MATVLAIVFFIAAIIVGWRILYSLMPERMMPAGCPKCFFGGDETLTGQHDPWFERTDSGYACRRWRRRFKEHPNGALVEDK